MLVGMPTASTTRATGDALQAALLKRRIPLFFVASRIVEWNRLEQLSRGALPFTVETPSAAEQEVFLEPTPAERLSPMLTPPGGEGSPWTQLPPVFATRTTLRVKPGAVALGHARGLTAVTPGSPAPDIAHARAADGGSYRLRHLALAAHGPAGDCYLRVLSGIPDQCRPVAHRSRGPGPGDREDRQ